MSLEGFPCKTCPIAWRWVISAGIHLGCEPGDSRQWVPQERYWVIKIVCMFRICRQVTRKSLSVILISPGSWGACLYTETLSDLRKSVSFIRSLLGPSIKNIIEQISAVSLFKEYAILYRSECWFCMDYFFLPPSLPFPSFPPFLLLHPHLPPSLEAQASLGLTV